MRDGPDVPAKRPRTAASSMASNTRRATVTLRDVAREAGVSPATASRALNGSTRNVRADNIERVRAAAAKLNYETNMPAQAIAMGSTATAALVVRGIDDPYFSSIAAGVVQRAEAADLVVTMAVADRSPERELHIVRTLRGHRPRTIVLAGSRIDGPETREALIEELEAYRTVGGSVAVISQHDLPYRTVSVDNFGGAEQLASALVGIGYRRFAVLRASDTLWTSRERVEGFLSGLRQQDADVDERHVVAGDFTRAGGYDAARQLIKRGLGQTELVFAVSDVMAIGAMTAIRDAGLVPGHDIAVAGFDDIPAAMDVTPALTSVSVPLNDVGWTAMDLALDDAAESHVVRISTEVVVRQSTPGRVPT